MRNQASSAPIIFDVTRLVTRLGRLTPNGIDRVDLAYARYLASSPHEVLGAIVGPSGVARLAPRHALVEIVRAISEAWGEECDVPSDGEQRATSLSTQANRKTAWRRFAGLAEFFRFAAGWAGLQRAGALVGPRGLWPGRELAAGALRGAVYLNVSQFPIWRSGYLAALDQRPDVRCYFLLHDLLPIRYPEFFRPFEVRRHIGRLETIATRASGVIVSSDANRRDLLAYFQEKQVRVPDILVAPLPIARAFRDPSKGLGCDSVATPPPPPAYFVCVGTIEPRKNHLFLLQVWRELIAVHGERPPNLILVGSKGWQFENVLDMLERCRSLQGRVQLASGLSTPALVTLLHGAKALLMPTFAEGYGLPVAEALQSGVPVIASDIEAFREVKEPGLTLVDAMDGIGWMRAIMEHLHKPMAASRISASPRLCHSDHVERVISRITRYSNVNGSTHHGADC